MFKRTMIISLAILSLSGTGISSASAKVMPKNNVRAIKVQRPTDYTHALPRAMKSEYYRLNFSHRQVRWFARQYHFSTRTDKQNLYRMTMFIGRLQNEYPMLQRMIEELYRGDFRIF